MKCKERGCLKMDLHLNGKSVIVTAASKGIGRAIATEFAREGASVLLASRQQETLQHTVTAIKQETNNEQVDYIVCNIKKATAKKAKVQKVDKAKRTI